MIFDWREWLREIQRLPITLSVGSAGLWLLSAAFGALQTAVVWGIGLPDSLTALGWILVFLGLSAASALVLRLVRWALQSPTRKPKERRGSALIPLDELLGHLMQGAKPFGAIDETKRLDAIDVALHDALGTNRLAAFGRPKGDWIDDRVGGKSTLTKIKLKFWEEGGRIEWHSVDVTKVSERSSAKVRSGKEAYYDLQFDRREIQQLWPGIRTDIPALDLPLDDPAPDLPIAEALDLLGARLPDVSERDVLDKLSLGAIHSWARPMKGGLNPLEPVPKEMWRRMTFQVIRQKNRKPFTRIAPPARLHQAVYYDVMLSRREVQKVWPELRS